MSYAATLDVAFATASGLEVYSIVPEYGDDDDDIPPPPGCAAPESAFEDLPASSPPSPSLAPADLPAPEPSKKAEGKEEKKKAAKPLQVVKNPAAAVVKPRSPSGTKRKRPVVAEDKENRSGVGAVGGVLEGNGTKGGKGKGREKSGVALATAEAKEEEGRGRRRPRRSYADMTPDMADEMMLDDDAR